MRAEVPPGVAIRSGIDCVWKWAGGRPPDGHRRLRDGSRTDGDGHAVTDLDAGGLECGLAHPHAEATPGNEHGAACERSAGEGAGDTQLTATTQPLDQRRRNID